MGDGARSGSTITTSPGLTTSAAAARSGSEAAIRTPRPRPAHVGERNAAGGAVGQADRRAVRVAAQDHCHPPADIPRNRRHRNCGQVWCPITLRINAGHCSPPPAMAVIIGDQPVAQRLVGSRLQALVEAGAHRQPCAVQHLVAVAGEQLASDLLGEIGCTRLLGLLPVAPLDRLALGLGRFRLGHHPILDHAVDDPIATGLCSLRAARRIVAVGRFRQPGEKGGFARASAHRAICRNRSARQRPRHRRRHPR